MSFWSNPIQSIETTFGLVKVDINTVVSKVISDVQLVGHEVDVLLKWSLSQASTIEAGLKAAAPIISAVGVMASVAATGNPAAGAAVTAAINGVNEAMALAEASVIAMNTANAAMSAASTQGVLVSDTVALAAGVQSLAGANAHVTALTNSAVQAAKIIQGLIPPKTA